MKALMIPVERAVRPVQARLETKMKMREELYAHLLEIVTEEQARGRDENTAVQSAIERLGDPADLAVSLQQSVSRAERRQVAMDDLLQRRTGESMLRHASRLSGYCVLLYAVTVAVTVLFISPIMVGLGLPLHGLSPRALPTTLRIVAGITVMMSVNLFLIMLLASAVRAQWSGPLLRPRSWRTLLGLGATMAVSVFLASTVLFYAATGNVELARDAMPRWLILGVVSMVLSLVVTRFVAMETLKSIPWTSLELGAE
jgi:hypothetical protein